MTNQTRRSPGTLRAVARPSTALAAAVVLTGGLALGACSKADPAGSAAGAVAQSQQASAGSDASTVDLVDAALTSSSTGAIAGADAGTAASEADAQAPLGGGDRRGLRARLVRALHATWVTEGKAGPVTHQAIRGDVTAVSGSSVTVKAKDGVSMTFSVSGDTKVRARAKGKGSDSTISAVHVGDKAFVAGVGATGPQARVVVFRSPSTAKPGTPSTPSPSATS